MLLEEVVLEAAVPSAMTADPCWEWVTWKKVPGSPTPIKRVEMMLGQAAARSLWRFREDQGDESDKRHCQ